MHKPVNQIDTSGHTRSARQVRNKATTRQQRKSQTIKHTNKHTNKQTNSGWRQTMPPRPTRSLESRCSCVIDANAGTPRLLLLTDERRAPLRTVCLELNGVGAEVELDVKGGLEELMLGWNAAAGGLIGKARREDMRGGSDKFRGDQLLQPSLDAAETNGASRLVEGRIMDTRAKG